MRLSVRIVSCAFLLALLPGAGLAQDPSFDGRLLPLRTDTFTVRYEGSVIGRGVMERMVRGAEHVQVYTWTPAGSSDQVVDSLFLTLPTLRTVRETRLIGDSIFAVLFSGDSVVVEVGRRDGPRTRTSMFGAAQSHSSAALEALVMGAPLASGMRIEARLFYAPPSTRGFVPVTIQVEGTERVPTRAGGVQDAWLVSASTPEGGTTFWIDQTTRAVLQFDTREGPALIQFRP
jgi:hypothetical protein